MKIFLKASALALAPLSILALSATPAMAQSKQAIGVANMERAIATSNAYKVAMDQMKVTYKTNIDAFTAKKAALDAELKGKADALRTAAQTAGQSPTPAQQTALQTQYNALQARNQQAQQELQTVGTPIARAQNYVEEQIALKLNDAVKAAMTKLKVDLVLREEATVAFGPTVDITAAVVTELNTLIPSASITPPAGWEPGQAGQTPGAAAAPAPAGQPDSR